MRFNKILITLCLGLTMFATNAFAEPPTLQQSLAAQGYVSVPLSRGDDGRYYVQGVVHGAKFRFMLDLSNDDSLFDIRALRKLDVAFERTEIVIPTKRQNVRIHTSRITGVEFAGKSTGELAIHAGEVDPIYNVRPGTDGPDGVLGAKFLATYAALMDFENQQLHMKLH